MNFEFLVTIQDEDEETEEDAPSKNSRGQPRGRRGNRNRGWTRK